MFIILLPNLATKAAMGRVILGSGEEESDPNWLRLLLRHYFRALLSALSALFDESIDRSRALLATLFSFIPLSRILHAIIELGKVVDRFGDYCVNVCTT